MSAIPTWEELEGQLRVQPQGVIQQELVKYEVAELPGWPRNQRLWQVSQADYRPGGVACLGSEKT